MMNFEEFCSYVESNILDVLGSKEERTASVKEVLKNNSVVLKGLMIVENESNISPTIYLEDFYEQMVVEEKSEEEILEEIASAYERFRKEVPDFDAHRDLREEKIIGVLVNREHNEELLKSIPSVVVNDSLVVIFKYLVDVNSNGIGTVTITDYFAELKGYSEKDLMRLALYNTPKLLEFELRNMLDVICDMQDINPEEVGISELPMYVISNQHKKFGAFCLLYPEVREQLLNRFDSDLVILPSSVHELIIIPTEDDMSMRDMDRMVQEVNATQVVMQEQLADRAFVLKQDGSDDISKFLSYYAPEVIGC